MTDIHVPQEAPRLIFDEITNDDFSCRFQACCAVEATIWGYGLRWCANPAERDAWQQSYINHLCLLYRAHCWRSDPQIKRPRQSLSPVATVGALIRPPRRS